MIALLLLLAAEADPSAGATLSAGATARILRGETVRFAETRGTARSAGRQKSEVMRLSRRTGKRERLALCLPGPVALGGTAGPAAFQRVRILGGAAHQRTAGQCGRGGAGAHPASQGAVLPLPADDYPLTGRHPDGSDEGPPGCLFAYSPLRRNLLSYRAGCYSPCLPP